MNVDVEEAGALTPIFTDPYLQTVCQKTNYLAHSFPVEEDDSPQPVLIGRHLYENTPTKLGDGRKKTALRVVDGQLPINKVYWQQGYFTESNGPMEAARKPKSKQPTVLANQASEALVKAQALGGARSTISIPAAAKKKTSVVPRRHGLFLSPRNRRGSGAGQANATATSTTSATTTTTTTTTSLGKAPTGRLPAVKSPRSPRVRANSSSNNNAINNNSPSNSRSNTNTNLSAAYTPSPPRGLGHASSPSTVQSTSSLNGSRSVKLSPLSGDGTPYTLGVPGKVPSALHLPQQGKKGGSTGGKTVSVFGGGASTIRISVAGERATSASTANSEVVHAEPAHMVKERRNREAVAAAKRRVAAAKREEKAQLEAQEERERQAQIHLEEAERLGIEERYATLKRLKERRNGGKAADENALTNLISLQPTSLHALKLAHMISPERTRDLMTSVADEPDRKVSLWEAARDGNLVTVKYILSDATCDVNAQDAHGDTALHNAVRMGHTEIALALLDDHRCMFETRDKFAQTPLFTAVLHSRIALLRLLIKLGGDVNTRDVAQNAPIHFAVRNGSLGIVKILLDAGAFVNIRNRLRQSPLDIATERQFYAIKDLVRRAGKIERTKLAMIELHSDIRRRRGESDAPLPGFDSGSSSSESDNGGGARGGKGGSGGGGGRGRESGRRGGRGKRQSQTSVRSPRSSGRGRGGRSPRR